MFAQKIIKFLALSVAGACLLSACDSSNTELPYLSWGMGDANYRYYSSTIWSGISRHFQLNHHTRSDEVKAQIRWLQQHQKSVYATLQAAAPYIYYINQQTTARGLPGELSLLPIIESRFNPRAYSRAGAVGLWQLMPRTANGLGIEMNHSYDGRRDVIASTNAALDYMNYLHRYFNNDWELAIAAYDCGAGNVQNAIRYANTKNYWELPLPKETRDYIPKLLALAAVIQNPARYRIQLPPINNAPYLAVVKINPHTNIKKVANSAGISIKTLHDLNPAYKQLAVSSNVPRLLLVPIEKLDAFKANIMKHKNKTPASLPVTANMLASHIVKEGDTLSKIAKEHHTTINALLAANHLTNSALKPNQKLTLPNGADVKLLASHDKVKNKKSETKYVTYTVHSGDSLYAIASRYKTTAADIARWNSMSEEDKITAGQELKIYSID